jgi:hydroxypyruvate reductase
VSLLVSDVPDATPDALASGPTMPDSTSVEDCRRIVDMYELLPQFPSSVRELFERDALDETPKSDDPDFVRSRWWTILSNKSAVDAAAAEAARLSFAVTTDNTCDDWDYDRAAEYLVDRVRELRNSNPRVCLISGGEVTVKVTSEGGIGGRNQQFALACAGRIAGENIVVLSAGTDGIDGNSPAAGAVVDGTTVARAATSDLEVEASLASFDAYPLFQMLEDAVITGPTGNNVRDLRILLAG